MWINVEMDVRGMGFGPTKLILVSYFSLWRFG